jgi:ABC-type multidrug transport system permease subunit
MGPLMKMEAYMMPITLFVIISRGIFVKGLGLVELWAYAAGLLAMGLIFIGLTILLFRKKLK